MKETIDTYSGPTARLIFAIFLSAARSLVRCSRRTSDNQGLEGAVPCWPGGERTDVI